MAQPFFHLTKAQCWMIPLQYIIPGDRFSGWPILSGLDRVGVLTSRAHGPQTDPPPRAGASAGEILRCAPFEAQGERDDSLFFVHPYTHQSLMLPGNANLPIGGLQDAIQENGVPRRIGKSLTLRMTVDRRLPLLRSIRGRVARAFRELCLTIAHSGSIPLLRAGARRWKTSMCGGCPVPGLWGQGFEFGLRRPFPREWPRAFQLRSEAACDRVTVHPSAHTQTGIQGR